MENKPVPGHHNAYWMLLVSSCIALTSTVATGDEVGGSPGILDAQYAPGLLKVLEISPPAGAQCKKPIVLLVAVARVKMIAPNSVAVQTVEGFALSHLTEEDTREFPTALELVNREDTTLILTPINFRNQKQGLAQLRKIYTRTHRQPEKTSE